MSLTPFPVQYVTVTGEGRVEAGVYVNVAELLAALELWRSEGADADTIIDGLRLAWDEARL